MKIGDKDYIGDGVYVALDQGMIRLTTENGIETTNTVYLEPGVWRALKAYVERNTVPAASEKETA